MNLEETDLMSLTKPEIEMEGRTPARMCVWSGLQCNMN